MHPFTLRIRGRILTYNRPLVAAIFNATPDSFYAGSRMSGDRSKMVDRSAMMVSEGADMIDVGAYSSRPGASDVSASEEIDRLGMAFEALHESGADRLPISVDTFRAEVARQAVSMGADIVNDISGGDLDSSMFETVASLHVPYILMHMRGTPSTMQQFCDYGEGGVTLEVIRDLSFKIGRLSDMGVNDIIVDPGFGFAKTLEQNYDLMRHLPDIIRILERPILVGISRKSMITRLLGISSDEALNATTVLNTLALDRGASILRVHDVRAAREAVILYQRTTQY